MGQHSSPKGPAAGLLSSRCLQMLLKEEGMRHSGKHGPVPTFMRQVAAIRFRLKIIAFGFYLDFTQHPIFLGELWLNQLRILKAFGSHMEMTFH